jgi:hypothetical protein
MLDVSALRFVLWGMTLLAAAAAHADAPDSLWSRTFGGPSTEMCHAIQATSDGGFVLVGSTESFSAVCADFWMVCTDSSGDSLWSRQYGGSYYEYCYSVAGTNDGGYILAGSRIDQEPIWPTDIWVIRTDANGDSLWSRAISLGGCEECFCVRQVSDSGYIVAGQTCAEWPGYLDFLLMKLDDGGEPLWNRSFGGSETEICYAAAETPDGGYILAGETASFGAGLADFWLLKTDADGDSLWSRTYGGTLHDFCYCMAQTSDGGYILGGETRSFGAGGTDFWVVKTNADGDSLWSRAFGGNSYEYCRSIMQTPDGGYLLAGYTQSFGSGNHDFWMVKIDANGDSLWSKTLGGVSVDVCKAALQTADGGYILAGGTYSFGPGLMDFWLVKVGPEEALARPYDATVYFSDTGTNCVLRWIAPQECDYNIYSTTQMGEIAGPPSPDWTLEVTLPDVPPGSASWTDPAAPVSYKRYAVTMSCP